MSDLLTLLGIILPILIALCVLILYHKKLFDWCKNRKKRKSIEKIEKIVKESIIIPEIPKSRDTIESEEEFIKKEDIKKIVEDNKKSVIIKSKSEIELLDNIAMNLYKETLLECIFLKDMSEELWVVCSLVRTKIKSSEIEKIEKLVDINKIIEYSKNFLNLDKKETESLYKKLLKVGLCGLHNSVFFFLIKQKIGSLNYSQIKHLIDQLYEISCLTSKELKPYTFTLKNQRYSIFFISANVLESKEFDIIEKAIRSRKNVISASYESIPNIKNLNISAKLGLNHIEWDKRFFGDGWKIALRFWKTGKEVEKNKYTPVDFYTPDYMKLVKDNKLIKCKITQENVNMIINEVIKSKRFVVKNISCGKENDDLMMFVEKVYKKE